MALLSQSMGSQEECDLGHGGSLQSRLILKELLAGGHLLTTLSVTEQQLLP